MAGSIQRFQGDGWGGALAAACLLAAVHPAFAVDRFVTPLGSGSKTGVDWANAYSNVQSAVNDCLGSASTIYMLTGRYAVASQVGVLNAAGLTFQGGCTGSGTATTTNRPTVLTRSGGNIRLLAATNSTLVFKMVTFTNGFLREGTINRGFTIKLTACQTTFTNCAIRDNNANANSDSGQYGTGIYADRGTLTIRNCLFLNNKDPEEMAQYGGAVYAVSVGLTSKASRFAGGTLRGNSAHGGGFYLLTCTNAWIEGCTFTSNSVTRQGANGSGAAIYASSSPNLVITNCVFEYGISDLRGAAITLTGVKQSTTLAGCDLRNNAFPGGPEDVYVNTTNRVNVVHTAIRNGAKDGIYLDTTGRVNLTNSLVVAMGRHGVYAPAGSVQAVNSTIADCAGWGITHAGSSLKVVDSIVWSNALGGITSPVLVMTNTCIQEAHGGAGTGNFTSDPEFIGGYYLSKNGLSMQTADSPCRDAGSVTAASRGLAGRTTLTDGTVDSGASQVDLGYHYAGAFAENLANLALYVDMVNGNDGNTGLARGTGSALKHITAALAKAIDGTVIEVAVGTYSTANGETLPIEPFDNHVTIRGTNKLATIINGAAAKRGVKVLSRGRFRLENVVVTNCLADNMRGGGLYVVSSDATVTNVWFTKNTTKSYADPGNADAGLNVCVIGGRLTMAGCDLDSTYRASGEAAYIKKGGGLYAENASLRLVQTTVRRNAIWSANGSYGMGVYLNGGDAWLDRCTFQTNAFTSSTSQHRGAAVYATGTAPLVITNCTFAGNYGVAGRGTLYLAGAALSAVLTECTLQNNSYSGWGDDVLDDGAGKVSLVNTVVSSGSGYGVTKEGAVGTLNMTNCLVCYHPRSGIYIDQGVANLANVTSAGNTGAGLTNRAGTVTVVDSIFWDNTVAGVRPVGSTTVTYSDSQEVLAGAGNVVTNPAFVAGQYLSVNGLPLQTVSSPCINAGSRTATAAKVANRTTRTDGAVDAGASQVDLGYHHAGGTSEISNRVLYVDVSVGNDANNGWAPGAGNALKTIKRSLEKAIDGSMIHIAAGSYNAAAGEAFPLVLQDNNLTLKGTNSTTTIVHAGYANRVFEANSRGRVRFEGLRITGGSANQKYGAGLYLSACQTTVTNCVIRANRFVNSTDAGWYGVGVYVSGGTFLLADSILEHNTNSPPYLAGGSGLAAANAVVTLRRSTIRGNRTTSSNPSYGAGVYLSGGGATIDGCTFATNSTDYGGGIFASVVSPLTITNSVFVGNKAYRAAYGGTVMYLDGAALAATIAGCTIQSNTSSFGRDTLWVNTGTVRIRNCRFGRNSGVGVYRSGAGTLSLTNCLVYRQTNHAVQAAAGTLTIGNCTFAHNTGWGATNSAGTVTVKNSVAWGNGVGGFGANMTVTYSDSQNAVGGTGNKNADPLFMSAAANNFRLNAGSPCINGGDSEPWMLTGTDLDATQRKKGSKVDMGCYESPFGAGSGAIFLFL